MIARKTILASLVGMALPARAFAQSDADLRNAAKTPGRVLTSMVKGIDRLLQSSR